LQKVIEEGSSVWLWILIGVVIIVVTGFIVFYFLKKLKKNQ